MAWHAPIYKSLAPFRSVQPHVSGADWGVQVGVSGATRQQRGLGVMAVQCAVTLQVA